MNSFTQDGARANGINHNIRQTAPLLKQMLLQEDIFLHIDHEVCSTLFGLFDTSLPFRNNSQLLHAKSLESLNIGQTNGPGTVEQNMIGRCGLGHA